MEQYSPKSDVLSVRDELLKIRKKLLDLTGRNRLLHFKFTNRTARAVEIKDELPDQVFECLVHDSKSMELVSLATDEEDEGNEVEFAEDVVQGDDVLASKLREGNSATEKPLPDNMLPFPRKGIFGEKAQNPVQPGELAGQPTELPLPPANQKEREGKHKDLMLQTDLPAKTLETRLRKMASEARSAIEETGVNLLYLAMGLLSWFESEDSQEERTAPLILIPVRLSQSRIAKEAEYFSYTLSYDGEDIESNVSLAEKLRHDFGLILPELGEDLAPEDYFQRVRKAISTKKRFAVRRRMVLGFFQFSKQRMYADLDPDQWTKGAGIAEHPLVSDILYGKELSDSKLFGEEYNLDVDQHAGKIPLIVDADSSQHSALLDAMAGKNLVIEGPPGTGKSQTITNLIAAALAEGKTVLFVSEKLAALEVVRRNLDKNGLGPFCLELHSRKARKQSLMEDLSERLRLKVEQPRDLKETIRRREVAMSELAAYAKAVGTPHPPTDDSAAAVLWKACALRSRLQQDLEIPKLPDLSAEDLHRAQNVMDDLAVHLRELGPVVRFPWRGFNAQPLEPQDQRRLISTVTSFYAATQDLEGPQISAEGDPYPHLSDTLAGFSKVCTALESLAHPKAEWDQLLVSVSPRAGREAASQLLRELALHRDLQSQTRKTYKGIEGGDVGPVLEALSCWKSQLLAASALNELPRLADAAQRISEYLEDSRAFSGIGTDAGLPPAQNMDALSRRIDLVVLAKEAPPEAQDPRISHLLAPQAWSIFEEADKRRRELEESELSLSQVFNLKLLPEYRDVVRIGRVIRENSGKWLSFLSSEYRWAKRAAREFLRDPQAFVQSKLGEYLGALQAHLEGRVSFGEQISYRNTLSPLFDGIRTDWTALERVVRWCREVVARAGNLHTARLFLSKLHDFSSCPRNVESLKQRRESFIKDLAQLRIAKVLTEANLERNTTDGLSGKLTDTCLQLKRIVAVIHPFVVSETAQLAELQTAADSWLKLNGCLSLLAKSNPKYSFLGPAYQGKDTDPGLLSTCLGWLDALQAMELPPEIQAWIAAAAPARRLGGLRVLAGHLKRKADDASRAFSRIGEFGELNPAMFFGKCNLAATVAEVIQTAPLRDLRSRLGEIEETGSRLDEWQRYCRTVTKAKAMGLAALVELLESGQLPPEAARECFLLAFYRDRVKALLKGRESLGGFSRVSYENTRKRFQELDREVQELTRKDLAFRIRNRSVPLGKTGAPKDKTEYQLIEHEVGKQRRHIPIRQLMSRAGEALKALKPCFMMSPLSVAQYLEPGRQTFDLVIMDEASQLRPEDALGAIARARQIVVVGDPNQLPPTTFFERIGDVAEEEEEAVLDDSESILEVCMRTYRPVRRLRWHYRSQHESLIAFSNSEFYQNDLIIVPSPTLGSESLGIRHHYVDGATFAGRKNLLEAQRAVQHVMQHVTRHPELSLGVATFNIEQKDLIEEILETVQKRDPRAARAIEKFNERHAHEPLFVKNLENLQGDERHVIFISCTYGPEPESRKVMQRFGPINHPQGWRRLNVLVTRARVRVEVFTSMRAQDVLVEPGSTARGRVALRNYLEYVETGKWKDPGQISERLPDSDFEVMIADSLRKHGYKCIPQVGVAGFFIDIGVLHPKNPHEFVLGIECDGASYHSQNSVRDRDRLRQEILEGRRWKLHRVWSTDWWTNPNGEVQRMLVAIESAIRGADATPPPRMEPHDEAFEKLAGMLPRKADVADCGDEAQLTDLLHRGVPHESRVQTSALFTSIASQVGQGELTPELWERLSEILEMECGKGILQTAWGAIWRPQKSLQPSVASMAVGAETKPVTTWSTIKEPSTHSAEVALQTQARSLDEWVQGYIDQLPAYSRSSYRRALEDFHKQNRITSIANLAGVKPRDIAAHRQTLCSQGVSERYAAQSINYLFGWFGWLQRQKVLQEIPFS